MEKKCPRCGRNFTCTPDDIFSCACADIYIPPNLAFQIDRTYDDCLCADCLKELIADFHQSSERKSDFSDDDEK